LTAAGGSLPDQSKTMIPLKHERLEVEIFNKEWYYMKPNNNTEQYYKEQGND